MVNHAQHCTVLMFEICTLAKFRADVFFRHNFMILLQTSKQISFTLTKIICKKLRKSLRL